MDKQKTQSKKLSPKELQEFESFKKWLTDKNYSPKNKEEVKKYYAQYQLEKAKASTEQKQKALHGAKLNYFRTLKHQCAEDEELYYYKKGGFVDCGCKKKDGGEVTKAENGTVVDKFKNRKPVPNLPTLEKNPGSTKQPMLDALKRKYHKNDYSSKTVKESQKDYDKGKGDHEVKKCGGKVKKDCGGSKLKAYNGAVAKFKAACGSKMKKHRNGGSLNGIPFYLGGTPKGGIEKSDNTKVNQIPNNGEAIYEKTPQGIGDFLPIIGTMRAAQRIDKGESNASYGDFATNLGMDLLGARMVGPVIKASAKASKLAKLLKSRGFNKITDLGVYRSNPNIYMKYTKGVDYWHPGGAGYAPSHTWLIKPKFLVKSVPSVDVSGVALLPLVLTLRVPATTSFKK